MTVEVNGQDDFLIIGNDSILLKRDYYSMETIDSSENRIYRKQVEPFGTDSFPKPRRLLKEYLFLLEKKYFRPMTTVYNYEDMTIFGMESPFALTDTLYAHSFLGKVKFEELKSNIEKSIVTDWGFSLLSCKLSFMTIKDTLAVFNYDLTKQNFDDEISTINK